MRILYAVGLMAVGIFENWTMPPSEQKKSTEIANIEDFMTAVM
ncbi:hypothetical protein [uncultured Microbulbifer sp.]|nr:hypothetical protein [uncultured Microbulbifer sp.]